MSTDRYWFRLLMFAVTGIALTAARSSVADLEDELQFFAKGVNVFKVDLPDGNSIERFELLISCDGETFHETSAGLPRAEKLLSSVQSVDGGAAILVPVIAGFEVGRFVLANQGPLWIRWRAYREDKVLIEVEQMARVGQTIPEDTAFLGKCAEPALLKRFFGDDFFERQTDTVRERMLSPEGADERALHLVAQLLMATRFNKFGDFLAQRRSIEGALTWADELSKLAFEFPDSTYAPYAAYYAGGCYSDIEIGNAVATVRAARKPGKSKDRVAEAEHRALLLASDALTPKADAAYAFAAERADEYLKPRVLLHFGILKGFQLQQEEAFRLWNEAVQAAPGDVTIKKPIDGLKHELQELKEH